MPVPGVTGANVVTEFASGTSISLNAPTRASGNLLLVQLWIEGTTKTPSTPSGWTALGSAEQGGVVEIFFFARIADTTATDNFSSSWTGSTNRFAELRRIVGNDPEVGSIVVGASNNGSGTGFTIKGATAVRAESLGLGFRNTYQDSETASGPSGWVDDGRTWAPSFQKALGPGATGDLAGTFTASHQWVTKLLIVPPSEGPNTSGPVIIGTNAEAEYTWATSVSLTAPIRSAGDALVSQLWLETDSKSPTTPSGWTLLGTASRSEMKIYVYGRIANNTATDNFASSWSGSTGSAAEMRRIAGARQNIAEWVVGSANNGVGTGFTINGATAPAGQSLAIAFENNFTESLKSATSGWTLPAEGESCPALTKTVPAGPTGNVTGEFVASDTWVSLMLIVPPARAPRLALLGIGA